MKKIFLCLMIAVAASGCQPKEDASKKVGSTEEITPARKEASRKIMAQSIALIGQKDYKEALAGLDASIRLDPTNQDPYLILGQILLKAGEFQRAADLLDGAAKNFPDNGMVFYMLSIANKMTDKKLPAALAARRSFEIFKSEKNEEDAVKAAVLLQQIIDMPDKMSNTVANIATTDNAQ